MSTLMMPAPAMTTISTPTGLPVPATKLEPAAKVSLNHNAPANKAGEPNLTASSNLDESLCLGDVTSSSGHAADKARVFNFADASRPRKNLHSPAPLCRLFVMRLLRPEISRPERMKKVMQLSGQSLSLDDDGLPCLLAERDYLRGSPTRKVWFGPRSS